MSIRLLSLHAGVPVGVLSHGHMELKFAKIYKRCFWSVLRLSSLSSTSFVERINVLTYQYRGVSVKCFQLSSSGQKKAELLTS